MQAITPVSLKEAPDVFTGKLGDSFVSTGFAIVADHGLDPVLIERALDCFKAFFALPDEVKRKYKIPGGGGQRGYTPFGTEAAKGADKVDLKEFWHVGRNLPPGHPYRTKMADNVWPQEIEGFEQDTYALYQAFDALGAKVLTAIARYLKLPEDFFVSTVANGNSILRALHYPPLLYSSGQGKPEGIRAEAHEDINTITLLLGAEEAGLQAKTRDGAWLDINPPPNCVVINIGDMLQRLTNGYLPSTTHRVLNPTAERAHLPRYSIPFFLHFAPDYLIKTLPSCVDGTHPEKWPTPITSQDYLNERLREIRLS